MVLSDYYWYFPSAISSLKCDEIIEYGKTKELTLARTGNQVSDNNKELTKEELLNLQKKRKSEVIFLNEQWIFDEIQHYVHLANENAGWNFQWDYSETPQFTKYGIGQHYGWHCDQFEKTYPNDHENINLRGKTRKLSVTVSLNDPSEYKGGEFEFDFRNQDPDVNNNSPSYIKKCLEILPKGSVVVFPSCIWHRVCPVTEGTRYSLVMWNVGNPFI